ncbi:MAG: O-antigen ligase family protein [Runella zeae]
MKISFDSKYRRQDFLLVLLLLIVIYIGFWNISVVFPVLLLGITFTILRLATSDLNFITFTWVDAVFTLLLFAEILNYCFSIYPPNSFLSFERTLYFFLIYTSVRIALKHIQSTHTLILGLSGYALLLILISFSIFLSFQSQLQLEGWSDISHFKSMFAPFKLFTNEWASIAVCFLPLPLIAGSLFRDSKVGIVLTLFAFALTNLSVFMSFSRGAYVSLIIFWVVLCLLLWYFQTFHFKILIRLLLIGGLSTTLMVTTISRPILTTLSLNQTVSQQRSNQGRLTILKNSLCQLENYWFLGVGSNNYPIVSDLCQPANEDQGFSRFTNNTYLQILIEKGILGLLVFSLFFLLVLRALWQNIKHAHSPSSALMDIILLAALISIFVRELFFSTLLYSSAVWTLTSVYVGIATRRSYPVFFKGQKTLWLTLGSLILGVSLWSYYQRYQYYEANRYASEAQKHWYNHAPNEALENIQKAIDLAPQVAPYHELAAFIIGSFPIETQSLCSDSLQPSLQALPKAIQYIDQALELNPHDAGFHFTKGWLSFLLKRNPEQTLVHFKQAIALDPNNTEFLVGNGLVFECQGDSLQAFSYYKQAIRRDPEAIDSDFFQAFEVRYPGKLASLIAQSTNDLQNKIAQNYSTILAAKLGKLWLKQGKPQEAKNILQKVIKELPYLSRPYCYLGSIAAMEGDTSQALILYRKSSFLNVLDYLPLLEMANLRYAHMQQDVKQARSVVNSYRIAADHYLNIHSLYESKAALKYEHRTDNGLVIQNLPATLRLQPDWNRVFHQIAQAYHLLKSEELATHYRILASKNHKYIERKELR